MPFTRYLEIFGRVDIEKRIGFGTARKVHESRVVSLAGIGAKATGAATGKMAGKVIGIAAQKSVTSHL